MRRMVTAGGVALVMVMASSCTGDTTEAPPTVVVTKGVVNAGVSATGSMSAIAEQNLGFPSGGQLKEVHVKVGDKVEAGQVLATVDDFAARQMLTQQRGMLKSQQALLDKLIASPAAAGAKDSVGAAQDVLNATRRHSGETLAGADVTVENAERQRSVDKKAYEKAKDQLEDAKRACGDNDPSDGDGDDDSSSAAAAPAPVLQDPACSNIPAAESAAMAAKQKLVASDGAVDTAKQQRDITKASGDLAVQNAEQALVAAKNNANSASSDRPFNIEQQRGSVISAQAAVTAAQREVDNAILKAPVAGTIAAVNGVVGEFLTPGTGTTPLAPGGTAPIPGVESGGSAALAAAAGGGATPTAPGAGQFMVLDNIDAFQVVVPFNESDAANIKPNQKVAISVDALPDITLDGTVQSVAPTATAIAGVVSYYVTVVVNGSDERLKDGQTVRATVVTQEVDGVLTVPSGAVRQENGRPTVTVVDGEGTQRSVSFEPGMVGADRTQVLSGLTEGQQVLVGGGQR